MAYVNVRLDCFMLDSNCQPSSRSDRQTFRMIFNMASLTISSSFSTASFVAIQFNRPKSCVPRLSRLASFPAAT